MLSANDFLITRLTTRLCVFDTDQVIGTGVLYSSDDLNDKIYVFTAAHCLFKDDDGFNNPQHEIKVDVFNPNEAAYASFKCVINHNLLFKDKEKDVAILILDKLCVEQCIGKIPQCPIVQTRPSQGGFAIKGFPQATLGKELDFIQPVWKQALKGVPKFQLYLNEDYDEWAMSGFSGSGVFLSSGNKLYLYGIFARYRPEGRGKTIYCQLLETVNELLKSNFLPEIQFSFLGSHGLDMDFFKQHVQQAILSLGPRFDATLNFRTPNVNLFNALAKDNILNGRLHKVIDRWLESGSRLPIENNEYTSDLHQILVETVDYVVKWWKNIVWSADSIIEEQLLVKQFQLLIDTVDKTLASLYERRKEEESKILPEDLRKMAHKPYDNEIYYVRELSINANGFINDLSELSLHLANNPFLIIKGEAGVGKSHLLGDIATIRINANKPTILLLGQLFSKDNSIWSNIANQLGVTLNKEQLLDTLQTIGKQAGSRTLILIDALNEGDGKQIWLDGLAGFLNDIKKYPHIGICLTVRTTYIKAILHANLLQDKSITEVNHQGFKGNEYAALKLFCQHYELHQPSFPILAPEFSSPLFLRIMCEGLHNNGDNIFPEGFHGFSRVLKYYIRSITDKLSTKRDVYMLRTNLVEKSIAIIAQLAFESSSRIVPLEVAMKTFDREFPQLPSLLADLTQESVFIQSIYKDYKTGAEIETLYFSYERFGDFIIAEQLLSAYKNAEALKSGILEKSFSKNLLTQNNYYFNNGIIEVFAILLPERFKVELYEFIEWVISVHGDKKDYWHIWQDVDRVTINSMKWREVSSIDKAKILKLMRRERFSISVHECLLMLLELTAIAGHPFNGDWLHKWLSKQKMPERDSMWQMFIYYYYRGDDQGQPYSVTRIIEWAWRENISENSSSESARLVGQCLGWYLATTNKPLRDKATKAMVNLLHKQPEALLLILKAFKTVDDVYIHERLWAVTYGCVLRMPDTEIKAVVRYTYNQIFKKGSPPTHLLLRDYARNIIEYAVHRKVKINVDLEKVRPPYNTLLPNYLPTDADIKKFDMPDDVPESKKDEARIAGRIHFDVMDWDFGEKEINSALNLFSSESFTIENRFKKECRMLNPDSRRAVKTLAKMLETEYLLKTNRYSRIPNIEKLKTGMQGHIKTALEIVHQCLNAEQHTFFIDQWLPYARNKYAYAKGIDSFDSRPLRRYIVQRAHELGFDMNLHGEFDMMIERQSHYNFNTELIGRKYSRIAFYEALCIATDNYYVTERRRSGKRKTYDGPWESYLRDIDPCFLTRRTDRSFYSESFDDDATKDVSLWWQVPAYKYWNFPDATWVEMQDDLPEIKQTIQRSQGTDKWLYLNLYMQWKEPKPVEISHRHAVRKEIYYHIEACLIKKKDKNKVVKYVKKGDIEHIQVSDGGHPSGLFNRENYWSPAAQYHLEDAQQWLNIEELRCKVMLASQNAVGEMNDDDSEAHFQYRMPCQVLYEGMGLQYGEIDGDFIDIVEGLRVAHNDNPRGLIISQKVLTDYLQVAALDIVWIVYGEKMAFNWDDNRNSHFKAINGIYYMDDLGNILGACKLTDRR